MEMSNGNGSESPPGGDEPRQISIPTVRPLADKLPPMSPLSPASSSRYRLAKRDAFPQAPSFTNTPFTRSQSYPVFRWILLVFFSAACVYTGGRILWSEGHTRLPYSFGPGLELKKDSAVYGLDGGYRLVELNGVPVGNIPALSEVLDGSPPKEARLRFEKQDGPRHDARDVVWVERPEYPGLHLSTSGSHTLGPNLDPGAFGMVEGERILDVFGPAPGDPGAVDMAGRGRTGVLRLTVQSANPGIPAHDLVVGRVYWPALWVRFAFGLLLGLIGVATFWLRPETKSSQGFLVVAMATALVSFCHAIPAQYRIEWENSVGPFLHCLVPAATLGFVLTFTSLRLIVPRVRRAMIPALGLGVAAAIANQALFPDDAIAGALGAPIYRGLVAIVLALLACALGADLLLRAFRVPLGATDWQRGGVVRLAALVGFLPIVSYMWVRIVWPATADWLFVELTLLAFPGIIAYTVVRSNQLDTAEIVREALIYAGLLGAVSAVYWASSPYLAPRLSQSLALDAFWIKSALLTALVLSAMLAHRLIRASLRGRFQGVPPNYDSLLESFSEKATAERMPQAYCLMAATELSRIAGTPHVRIVTRYPGDDHWVLSAQTGEASKASIGDTIEPLMFLLQASRREVFRDDLRDDVRYGEIRWRALEAMEAIHASVVFPMMIHDRMIGAVGFGDRAGPSNYPVQELRALRRVTRHMAFTLWGMVDTLLARRNVRIVDIYPAWPETIGRWRIKGFLGRGGMSYVYHGHDNGVDAAIKVANAGVQSSVTLLERFHREAVAMKRIVHPNIMRIHEVAHVEGEPYMALEYFPGGSLRDMIRDRGPLDESTVLDYARQAVLGLATAHKHGVIHRDVKPRNLFLSADGVLKIGDFGLARMDDISAITSVGDVLGTPDYMGPEVARGEHVDWRADQYALGITMYELLAGKRPFKADRADTLIYQYLTSGIPDIRKARPEVTAAAAHLIARMLAKDPNSRYPSYDELHDAIAQALLPLSPGEDGVGAPSPNGPR